MADDDPTDAVLMTLAGIAYAAPADVARCLEQAAPTADAWRLTWLAQPADPPVNFAYLASHTRSGASVIAIRGTYPNPFSPAYWDDGRQDSPFGPMVDWPDAPGARISAGTSVGLKNLLALRSSAGQSLHDAVAARPAGPPVWVTGHSLGGTLAPALALCLSQTLPARDLRFTSFAGMTPGNKSWAALLGPGTRWAGRARRVFNTLDTVAYGWDQVWATHDFYQPAPQGGLLVAGALLATAARLKRGDYDYAAVGEAVPLTGTVRPPSVRCDLVAYVFENLYQHLPDTYLGLLGAPPLPFSLSFGPMVLPRSHPAALPVPTPHQPAVYLR